MVEWGIQPEQAQISMQALGLLSLAMAFRRQVKEEVRRRQDNICDSCGEQVDQLSVHHIKPESWGGSSGNIANGVGLCRNCHDEVDRETFDGNPYPQVHDERNYYPQGNGLNE